MRMLSRHTPTASPMATHHIGGPTSTSTHQSKPATRASALVWSETTINCWVILEHNDTCVRWESVPRVLPHPCHTPTKSPRGNMRVTMGGLLPPQNTIQRNQGGHKILLELKQLSLFGSTGAGHDTHVAGARVSSWEFWHILATLILSLQEL